MTKSKTGMRVSRAAADSGYGWISECLAHNTFVGSATRALARATHTVDFCDECRSVKALMPRVDARLLDRIRDSLTEMQVKLLERELEQTWRELCDDAAELGVDKNEDAIELCIGIDADRLVSPEAGKLVAELCQKHGFFSVRLVLSQLVRLV